MFIGNLWKGEYSLAKTYWLFNFLLGGILGAPISVLASLPPETLGKMFLPFLVYFFLYLVYVFIASVGLWRSATKYDHSAIWRLLGKACSVVSMATIVISIGILGQGLFLNNLAFGNSTYKVYSCQNIKAQTDDECQYRYVGETRFSVDKDKSEVLQTFKLAGSDQQNITKLPNCVVVDSQNWQCGLPDETKIDSSGSGVVVRHHITRSTNGAVSVTDAYMIGMHNGKPVSNHVIKGNKLEKN